MTEQEWLLCTEPRRMLDYLCGDNGPYMMQVSLVSEGKLRLFAAACVHYMYGSLDNLEKPPSGWSPRYWAEHWASPYVPQDNDANKRITQETKANLLREIVGNPFREVRLPRSRAMVLAKRATVVGCCERHADNQGCECLAEALESIPWLTPGVLTLAKAAEDGDFSVLGPLADLLEESGCGEESILRHLRGFAHCIFCGSEGACRTGYVKCDLDGVHDTRTETTCVACSGSGWMHPGELRLKTPVVHIPGCWAIDLLLGRA